MIYSLCGIFTLLDGNAAGQEELRLDSGGGELFAEIPSVIAHNALDADIIASLYAEAGMDLSLLPEPGRRFFELSVDAFDALVHAWMSEFPIDGEMLRYGRRVLASAARPAAAIAAADRSDADTRTVLEAAYKTRHEIDRLRGFLRFSPDSQGVYTAFCAPDHFSLPALGEHFALRFGDTPWLVIDEKRRLSLCRAGSGRTEFRALDKGTACPAPEGGPWEELWRQYHKTANNESRNNPALQRRFLPARYRKYLTEL